MHRLAARRLLKQHLSLQPDMPGVEGLRLTVREVEQSLRAKFFVLIAHRVGNAQSRSARTLRVREHMQLCHVQAVEKLVGLLETLGRLPPTPHHHVDTNKGIRHQRLDPADLVGKELGVVVAMHQFQHGVATALQGDMEVRHKGTALSTIGYQLVAQQVGLQRTDSVAADALHLVQRLHQVDEALTRRLTEVANVHARQHYLAPTLLGRLLSLLHQRGDGRIARETSGVRYRTVGTEVVAAVLHLQEVARAVTPRTAGSKRGDVLRLPNIIRCSPRSSFLIPRSSFLVPRFSPRLREILYQMSLLIRAQHEVDSLNLRHSLCRQLRVTARHHHEGTRMLAHHPVDSLTALMIGHLSHRTSVDQADVRLLTLLSCTYPHLLQHFPESRGL